MTEIKIEMNELLMASEEHGHWVKKEANGFRPCCFEYAYYIRFSHARNCEPDSCDGHLVNLKAD